MSGYLPTQGQRDIKLMLEKSKDNCRVDTLITILLHEADFTLMNKYVIRDMFSKAEMAMILAKEQYKEGTYY